MGRDSGWEAGGGRVAQAVWVGEVWGGVWKPWGKERV